MMKPLPPTLFTDEFAKCIRASPATVRRGIRALKIKAHGRPHRIPVGELAKFGITPAQAAEVLMTDEATPYVPVS